MRGEGDPQAGADDGSRLAFSCTVMLGPQRPPVHTAVKVPSMGVPQCFLKLGCRRSTRQTG